MSKFDHVIFDLDGTLVDSAVLCTSILNEMLRERGSARQLTVDCARPHMSYGGAHLVAAMLDDECRGLEKDLSDFRARYAALPTPETCLFEGVRHGLHRLQAMGLTLSICSNKPQNLCEKVVSDLGLDDLLSVIVGTTPTRRHKPHPQLMDLTLKVLKASAHSCLFVGDSEQDHALAEVTGVPFRLVTYGYASPSWSPRGVPKFDSFGELVRSIEGEDRDQTAFRRVA